MRVPLFKYLADLFSLSDERAMARLQKQNDERAFALLVRRWQDRIQRLCARLTGDIHRGEDIAQEVFMSIFAHRNDYRHEARFGTYIKRIAINACHDEWRRLERRPESPRGQNDREDTPCDSTALASGASPDTVVAGQERAGLVRKALFRLPECYRQVLILRHYEGLRFREIAEVVGIPQGTVKSRMAEGLNRLAGLLKPILNEESPGPTGRRGRGKTNGKEVS